MGLILRDMAARLTQKLQELQKHRPLPSAIVEKLRQQFAVEMTYNSNAIEGNRLTLKETYLVINDGITVKGKSLKDHLEAKDHFEAIHLLYDLIEPGKRNTLSERLVRSLQQLIIAESAPQLAGSYRTGDVRILGSAHIPPPAHDVPILMKNLLAWIHQQERSQSLHIVELAAIAHHKLVAIHPFFDGNGRTARLFMNLLLMQKGYPLVVILKHDRKKYYAALEKADKGDLTLLIRFIAQAAERSLDIYLRVLKPKHDRRSVYLPLSKIAATSPYSGKYLNLLVRQGKLEAHKEGRIWVTTKAALDRYRAGRIRKRISTKK